MSADPAARGTRDQPVTAASGGRPVELVIGGMTCASCAARVEKKLSRLDGVTATVNFATGLARAEVSGARTAAELIAAVDQAGYTASLPVPATAGDTADGERAARLRLIACAALAVPVMVLAMAPPLQFAGWQWLSLALAAPVASWGAWPFHRAAVLNARHRTVTMDTLICVGVTAAFCWSLYALIFTSAGQPGMRMPAVFLAGQAGRDAIYLDAAAGVTTLVLLGRYLEDRARRSAGGALAALARLGARDAVVIRGGAEVRVPARELAAGEVFVTRPGEALAADGVVQAGNSAVDTAMLTGEPVPAEVGPGDTVPGGSVNLSGRLTVRATRVGADTQLARITRLVADAQAGKAPVQRLADRVASVFVPVVIAVALATLAGWLAAGQPPAAALSAAIAVLIIACPCAMGLAAPTAMLAGTGRGAQLGVLIRGPQVLETARGIDTIVLDKTGTLTTGVMSLAGVAAAPGEDPGQVLALAGAAEQGSAHPIAAAISRAALAQHGPSLPPAAEFPRGGGLGVTAEVAGHSVAVGRADWLAGRSGPAVPESLAAAAEAAEAAGQTVVFAAWDGQVRGALMVADTLRPEARAAVARLRGMGLHPVLLTGDHERAARAVAGEAGIDEVIAGVAPQGKAEVIAGLQAAGRVVAMAGDGVNDAAALARADLGLAMGSGTDVAIEAADVTLVRPDLAAVPAAIALSRRTLRTIKGNLWWAFGYNVVAIPLAAAGLLSPLIAAAAMAASSVFVVSNSLRLRRFTPAG